MLTEAPKHPPSPRQFLRKRQDFLYVASGRRIHLPLLTLQFRSRPTEADKGQMSGQEMNKQNNKQSNQPRFGLTITKKIGNAVVRNRIRRRLRAALAQMTVPAQPAHDYVIVARTGCLNAAFHKLVEALNQALQKSQRPLKPSATAAQTAPPSLP